MLRRFLRDSVLTLGACAVSVVLSGCSDAPTQPVPDEVLVTASSSWVTAGDSITFSASYQFGSTNQPADDRVRWSSSDSTLLRVDSNGRGYALNYTGKPVPVYVTATVGSVSGSTYVSLNPKFDSLVVTVSATLAAGLSVRPTLAVHRFDGYFWTYSELPDLSSRVALSSSDPAVVVVSSDGMVHAVAPGHAIINGELEGRRTAVPIDVIAGYPVTVVPGTEGFTARDVNDAGDVVGYGSGVSYLWTRSAGPTDLGICAPVGINNSAQIACSVVGSSLPGLWSQGNLTVFFDGSVKGSPSGINESGTMVGILRNGSGTPALFLASPSAVTYPALGYSTWYGTSFGVNSARHVAVIDGSGYDHSLIIGGDSSINLWPAGGRWADVRDLNDADDAVGNSEHMGWSGGQATVWRAANHWHAESPSYRADTAVSISEAGRVIGNGRDGPWTWRNGRYTILNQALAGTDWTLTHVAAISRSGLVAAQATSSTGVKSVVLLDLGAP